ncbi:kinase-like domain-containing protein [Scleroderma citrinum]
MMEVSMQEHLASELAKFCVKLDGRIGNVAPRFSGGYAIVYKGILLPEGTIVAIKTGKSPGDKIVIEHAWHEVLLWSKLCHENIASLCGFTIFDASIALVSPWQERGNAHDYVQKSDVDPRPLLLGIARGLDYLHAHDLGPIVHGDLKGHNVLVSDDGHALLTDFGASSLTGLSLTTTLKPYRGGTLRWMAPELLDDEIASVQSDVWAFGMTALELFTRQVPFHGIFVYGALFRIATGTPSRPTVESTYNRLTDAWWCICMECWQRNPASRPSMSDIITEIERLILSTMSSTRQAMILQWCLHPSFSLTIPHLQSHPSEPLTV